MVTDALPTAEVIAWLVACTVTIPGEGTADGAVYKPLIESMKPTVLLPPTCPFTSQVTDWFAFPETVALNWRWAFTATLALGGFTLTDTEVSSACPVLGSTISGETSTASKLEPSMLVSACRSSLFQRASGAPEMNHEDPLSASIIP